MRTLPTISGILAIVFWGTLVAFSRSLTEQLGTLTAASGIFLVGGAVGCLHLVLRPGGVRRLLQLPRLYLAGCGALFVIYSVCFYGAVGLAVNRQQLIEVGIINYLWPSLTLILSIPVLGRKAMIRRLLLGTALAFTGASLAVAQSGSFSWEVFRENVQDNGMPYLLAFMGAISWGLYSNLARRWARGAESGAVPVFVLAKGIILTAARCLSPEAVQWTPRVVLELLYMAIFPTLLAYIFWDAAMRKGRNILVASLSYFIPLLSTCVSALYLQINVGPMLWIACVLVMAGAMICYFSMVRIERAPKGG